MGEYSEPCTPAISARTGPGLAPCAIVSGINVPSSPVEEAISMRPDAFSPGRTFDVSESKAFLCRGRCGAEQEDPERCQPISHIRTKLTPLLLFCNS
jgi:hypothetical protein